MTNTETHAFEVAYETDTLPQRVVAAAEAAREMAIDTHKADWRDWSSHETHQDFARHLRGIIFEADGPDKVRATYRVLGYWGGTASELLDVASNAIPADLYDRMAADHGGREPHIDEVRPGCDELHLW